MRKSVWLLSKRPHNNASANGACKGQLTAILAHYYVIYSYISLSPASLVPNSILCASDSLHYTAYGTSYASMG